MKRNIAWIGLFLVFIYSPVFADENPVVAKIGDKKITLADFNRFMGYYDADKQKVAEESPQIKTTLLRRYVQAMVISEKAIAEGFDKRADVKEKKEMLVNDFLASEYLRMKTSNISDIAPVQDDEIGFYYKAHNPEFTIPEEIRTRHLLVRVDNAASMEDKKKARERIEGLLRKIKAGEDFAMLASEFSEDQGSKAKGGDLDYFKKGVMLPEFEKAAFALKPGELSGIVETKFGFHIIKMEAKKDAVVQPLESVKEKIKEQILSSRKKSLVGAIIDDAMKRAGVEMNLEPLMLKR